MLVAKRLREFNTTKLPGMPVMMLGARFAVLCRGWGSPPKEPGYNMASVMH